MAQNNLERFYIARFNTAVRKLSDDDSQPAGMQELRELLLEPQLPRLLRLRANFALADLSDDWQLAEGYRLEAERVYAECGAIWPVGDTQYPEQERTFVDIRQGLDELARDQIIDNPENTDPIPGEDAERRDRLPEGNEESKS